MRMARGLDGAAASGWLDIRSGRMLPRDSIRLEAVVSAVTWTYSLARSRKRQPCSDVEALENA